MNSVKKNYVFNLIYQIIILLMPIVMIPYLSRVLLDEGVGIFSYSESIVSYFTLFAALGSTTYAQREIGKVQQDKEKQSKVFWEIFIIRVLTSTIALGAYFIYLAFVQSNFTIALIFTLNIVNVIVDITWFFQGIEQFGKTVVFGLICKLLNFIFVFLFIKSQSDLGLYAAGKCGFILIGNIGLWALLPKHIEKPRNLNIFNHFKPILSFFVPTIATSVYMILDKSMIGWFSQSSNENGYYDYAEKIVRLTITLITALSTVLIPRVSNAYAKSDFNKVQSYIYQGIRYVWCIAVPLFFGFLAMSDVFIPIYLGDGFAKSTILMQIFSPLVLFVGMANIIGLAFLMPINKQNVYLIAVVVAAVSNIMLNLLLIPRLYSVGAAIASVVAEFIGIVIQLLYCFRKRLLNPKISFVSSIKNWIAGAIMFAALMLLKYFVLPVAIWSLIVLVASGVIIYFLALLAMRDAFLMEVLKKAIAIFNRKKKSDETNSEQS